jgi:hypothetical protein
MHRTIPAMLTVYAPGVDMARALPVKESLSRRLKYVFASGRGLL